MVLACICQGTCKWWLLAQDCLQTMCSKPADQCKCQPSATLYGFSLLWGYSESLFLWHWTFLVHRLDFFWEFKPRNATDQNDEQFLADKAYGMACPESWWKLGTPNWPCVSTTRSKHAPCKEFPCKTLYNILTILHSHGTGSWEGIYSAAWQLQQFNTLPWIMRGDLCLATSDNQNKLQQVSQGFSCSKVTLPEDFQRYQSCCRPFQCRLKSNLEVDRLKLAPSPPTVSTHQAMHLNTV